MTDIQEVLREMREMREINSNFRVTAEWESAIEAAMREPKAYISHTSQGDVLDWEPQFDAPSRTKLFAFPPSAQAELVRITEQLAERDAEIERLRGLLFDVLATKQISPLPMWLRGEIKAALAGKETR